MKKMFSILLLGFLSEYAFALDKIKVTTSVRFENLTPKVHTVYFGEQAVITLMMISQNLKDHQRWRFPANVGLQVHTPSTCPSFISGKVHHPGGCCLFSLIINGNQLGKVINGFGMYALSGKNKNGLSWELVPDPKFSVRVIPHPLSIANIPLQMATANLPVYFDLKTYVNYFDENLQAGALPRIDLFPPELDGLYYDPSLFAIVGKPSRIGTYPFKVVHGNILGKLIVNPLTIEVGTNQSDKPIFKTNVRVPTAWPGQHYEINLMEFIVTQPSFLKNNALHFRIDLNEIYPSWLKIEDKLVKGVVPFSEAGRMNEVTVIASSNTGGDSKPLKLKIPVANDPANKPSLRSFLLEATAGNEFEYDLRKYINDPTNDEGLRLIIDKIEPEISWVNVSPSNPSALHISVPKDASGQNYQLSLYVNTRMGGNSELSKMSLSIAIDKEKTPRFKTANPQLPILHPGTPFEHDFVANRDIFPDFEDDPYEVELALNYPNPPWLRIENNKLISNLIPEELEGQMHPIYLTIKNSSGGKSEAIPLMLFAMV